MREVRPRARLRAHPAPDLLGATIADGVTAFAIVLAMSAGVIIPKMAVDFYRAIRTPRGD